MLIYAVLRDNLKKNYSLCYVCCLFTGYIENTATKSPAQCLLVPFGPCDPRVDTRFTRNQCSWVLTAQMRLHIVHFQDIEISHESVSSIWAPHPLSLPSTSWHSVQPDCLRLDRTRLLRACMGGRAH